MVWYTGQESVHWSSLYGIEKSRLEICNKQIIFYKLLTFLYKFWSFLRLQIGTILMKSLSLLNPDWSRKDKMCPRGQKGIVNATNPHPVHPKSKLFNMLINDIRNSRRHWCQLDIWLTFRFPKLDLSHLV